MVTADTKDSVSLSWNAVTGTTSYKVEYPMTGSVSWFLPRQAYPSTSNTLGRLDDNTSDDFQVRGDGRRQALLHDLCQPRFQIGPEMPFEVFSRR